MSKKDCWFDHVLAPLVVVMLLAPVSNAQAQTPPVRYEVSVGKPMAKLFHVNAKAGSKGREFLQLDWPAWTPGYAAIWNYGQHVVQVTAKDGSGTKLRTNRISENRWVIVTHAAPEVEFSYDVKAIDTDNDLGFVQAYLDSVNGWYNGAALFPEIDGFRNVPHAVSFTLPAGWQVATAMKPSKPEGSFQVADYDELVDSPVQLGQFLRKDITIAGIPISIVLAGIKPYNIDSLAATVGKIVEYEFQLMGEHGVDRFLFLFHSGVRGAGGLEHMNTTTISLRREEYTKQNSWLGVVVAHEFFHAWNAKRVHTELFDVYDYSRVHRSKEVWFAEGITAYYADLALYRTGLMTKAGLFKSLAEILDLYENNRAHTRLSWEDISWYIWDEDIRLGLGVWHLPGWMIDLKIRDVSDNKVSLDDVMRYLNVKYGKTGKGYPQSGMGKLSTTIAKHDIRPFFDRHIGGYDQFPLDSLFGVAGLRWNKTMRPVADIGCELFWSLQLNVRAIGVEEGGPSYAAGIRSGDIVTKINGNVFKSRQDLAAFTAKMKSGDTLNLAFQRGPTEYTASVIVGSRDLIKSTITEIDRPDERQRRILKGILEGSTR